MGRIKETTNVPPAGRGVTGAGQSTGTARRTRWDRSSGRYSSCRALARHTLCLIDPQRADASFVSFHLAVAAHGKAALRQVRAAMSDEYDTLKRAGVLQIWHDERYCVGADHPLTRSAAKAPSFHWPK